MSKDIFVVAEQRGGQLQRVSLELVCEAQKLAAELGQQVKAVLLGEDVAALAQPLFEQGATEVVLVEDPMLGTYVTEPYAKALTAVLERYDPAIVLYGATSIGRDLAPRVAARIHTGLTADCTGLAIGEDSLLEMTRPAFGGNLMATILCPQYRPQMATVRPGVMELAAPKAGAEGTLSRLEVAFDDSDMNVKILEVVPSTTKQVDICAAPVLVSGGRGVGQEGVGLLQELADELKGEVAASRVCVDDGWIAKERQVGQTGKTVRPKLYMACGISGALQHMAGMEDSEFILAINRDAHAPMMAAADLGIVGDVKEILPKLIKAVRAYKQGAKA